MSDPCLSQSARWGVCGKSRVGNHGSFNSLGIVEQAHQSIYGLQEPMLELLHKYLDSKGKQAKLKSPNELQVGQRVVLA